MNILTILTIVLVLIAIGMIALILLQRGAGATTGAAFGSGASGTVFGARGAASFLTRTTGVMAAMFFAIALAMAVMVSRGVGVNDSSQNSVMDALNTEQATTVDTTVDAQQNMISVDDLPPVASENAQDSNTDAATDLPAASADTQTDQGDDDSGS